MSDLDSLAAAAGNPISNSLDMRVIYHLHHDGQTYGPFSQHQLQKMADNGRISSDMLVKSFYDGSWYSVESVVSLVSQVQYSTPKKGPSSESLAITSILVSLFFPLVGLILGYYALSKMKRNRNSEGRGFAIASVVIGWIVVASWTLVILLIVGIIGATTIHAVKQEPPKRLIQEEQTIAPEHEVTQVVVSKLKSGMAVADVKKFYGGRIVSESKNEIQIDTGNPSHPVLSVRLSDGKVLDWQLK